MIFVPKYLALLWDVQSRFKSFFLNQKREQGEKKGNKKGNEKREQRGNKKHVQLKKSS